MKSEVEYYKNSENKIFGIESDTDKNYKNKLIEELGLTRITSDSLKDYLCCKTNPSVDEMINYFTSVIQKTMDDRARQKGYDNITNACSYAGTDNAFKAEADAFLKWRAKCWAWGYAILDEFTSGRRVLPSSLEEVAAIIKGLPKLNLPM